MIGLRWGYKNACYQFSRAKPNVNNSALFGPHSSEVHSTPGYSNRKNEVATYHENYNSMSNGRQGVADTDSIFKGAQKRE